MQNLMTQIDIDRFQIVFGEQGGPTAPWWWMDAVFGWLAICGIMIYLFGGKLVRPSLAFVGLLVGGGTIGVIGLTVFPQTPPVLWFIAGAIVGSLACFILHRLIMGLLIGVTAAIIFPVAVSLVQGHPMPDLAAPINEIGVQVRQKLSQNVRENNSQNIAAIAYADLSDIIGAGVNKAKESFGAWWSALSGGGKTLVATSTAGGLILGLIIGMALPGMGGMLATACIGAVLILAGVVHLGNRYFPEMVANLMPASSTALVGTLGVATLIGLIIQWRILRQKADE